MLPNNIQLPATVRTSVWNITFGVDSNVEQCYCCSTGKITRANFHCGHITSRNCGGSDDIDNLKPICAHCNLSMGAHNMFDFMKKYGLDKLKDKGYIEKLRNIDISKIKCGEPYHAKFLRDVKLNKYVIDGLDNDNNLIFFKDLYENFNIWCNENKISYILPYKDFKIEICDYTLAELNTFEIDGKSKHGIDLTDYFNTTDDLNQEEIITLFKLKVNKIKQLEDIVKNITKDNSELIESNNNLKNKARAHSFNNENDIYNDIDIMEWFNKCYVKTDNKNDYIKMKDMFDQFKLTDQYIRLTKRKRRQYNYTYFIDYFRNNDTTKSEYKETYKLYINDKRTTTHSILLGWKNINDHFEDTYNVNINKLVRVRFRRGSFLWSDNVAIDPTSNDSRIPVDDKFKKVTNDFQVFNQFNNLEYLHISQDDKLDIQDLSFIRDCRKIKELHLGVLNNLTDIDALQYLPNLEILELYGCPNIKNIEVLTKCAKLKIIKTDSNGNDQLKQLLFPYKNQLNIIERHENMQLTW